MDIRSWLQEHYAPAVLVASTPAAEALVQAKNGLSLVDLLRPYSHVFQLNAPIRVGETAVRLQDLKVRFHDAATMYQPTPEVMEEHLLAVLKAAGQRHAQLQPASDLMQRFTSDRPPDIRELTPWYDAYRSEFLRLLRFGDHETLDHPVACVLAIPADVSNPASHFDALLAQLPLPPLMAQDVMYTLRDRDFPRHYLLLWDAADGSSDRKALENLAAIRKLYGEAHCSLMRINSGNGDRAHSGVAPEAFARYQFACLPGGGAGEPLARPPQPPGGAGAYLTVSDLDSVGGFVREFVSRTLLPRLEDRIARLNAAITATRRGLRNRLNRFWKGAAEDRQNDRPYPWHSVESQMRQLGDLAFLLRQYAFAESTYRLAAQDYLADGNSKWYAGVEEMIGLCTVLGEPVDPIAAVLLQTDPMKYFMRAYDNYSRPPAAMAAAAAAAAAAAGGGGAPAPAVPAGHTAVSKLGRMLATRVIMLGAAVQMAFGRPRAASEALMRAQSEEENARAGLLLEQSAYAMLCLRPPLVRKFAFQMVLAGIRYICCGQKRIAIHAYRQVLAQYLGHRWRYIEEHLHAVLGAQCVEYGDKERALWHYCALLDCAHRPPQQQATHVQQFLNLLAGVRDQAAVVQDGVSLVDALPLPLVNRHDVRVLCSDTACYGGPLARTVPDATWLKMEACCAASSASTNWLDAGAGKQERDHEEYTTCVCGEEVGVQVEFRNPLAVKLKVSNVCLICEFTPEGDAATRAASAPPAPPGALGGGPAPVTPAAVDPLQSSGGSGAAGPQPGSEYLHIAEAQFSLHPGEALVEVLRVTPRLPGWLRVTGVAWTLNGTAHGRIAFDVKGRKRKRPKGTRPGQLKHYPPHRRLLFQAVAAMPRLELMADPLPPALYSGELCRVTMQVRNTGGLPLRSLALVVGHPEAAVPATDANMHRPLLEAIMDPREVVQLSKFGAVGGGGGPGGGGGSSRPSSSLQLYRLWPGRELAPGETLEWPLWLHPRGVGTLKLPLVWYGEPVGHKTGMRHRTLRVCGSVSVQPLLAARPSVWPSPTHLAQHLLRLTIENSKDGERAVVQQAAAVTVPLLSHGGPAPGGGTTPPGAATPPATPATPTSRPQAPAGWRIALLDAPGAASPSAPTTPTRIGGEGDAANGAAAARSLPLAVALNPGEAAGLFLQLIAPPPKPLPLPPASAASALTGSGPTGGASSTASHQVLPPGVSPSVSGMTTPGQAAGGEQGSELAAAAVLRAAEVMRSMTLTDRGGGGSGGVGGRSVPYVDGSDAALQGLNLFGPGVLAHFYRRARRGMVAANAASVAAANAAATAATVPPLLQPPPGPPGTPPANLPYTPERLMPPYLAAAAAAQASPGGPPPGGPPLLPGGGPQPLPHSSSVPAMARSAMVPGQALQPGQQLAPPLHSASNSGHHPAPARPGGYPMGPGGGGSGPGRPHPPLPLADPPLDLLLLWHIASSTRSGPAQGQRRVGLCRPYDPAMQKDLSGALQAQIPPIRMLLTGPNGASSAASSRGSAGPVLRHDFRRSCLAVVPLRLAVRNNTAMEARLQMEVGDGWSPPEPQHCWQASTGVAGGTALSSTGAAAATSGPTGGMGGMGAPGGMSMSMMGPQGPMGGPGALMSSSVMVGSGGPGMGMQAAAGPGGGAGAGGAGGGAGSSITYQAGLPPSPDYTWVGTTTVTVPRLQPGGEVELQLAVAVFRPGAYLISGHRCTVTFEGMGVTEVQRGEPLCFRVEGTG